MTDFTLGVNYWPRRKAMYWWNNFDGQTDTQGIFNERGFYGNYEVTVTIGEESRVFEFTLSDDAENEFEFSFAD